MPHISVDLHSAISGSFFTMYNRRRSNDPTPLSSDFRVMEAGGTHSKAIVGMGVSEIALKTKTPTTLSNIDEEKIELIANNVKNMLTIAGYIFTNRSTKVSSKEILIFSKLTILEQRKGSFDKGFIVDYWNRSQSQIQFAIFCYFGTIHFSV